MTTSSMSIQLKWIDIHHDLAITAAERLRHRRSRYARDLIPYVVLAEIAQLSFSKPLALSA